jgi:hypothetical protein
MDRRPYLLVCTTLKEPQYKIYEMYEGYEIHNRVTSLARGYQLVLWSRQDIEQMSQTGQNHQITVVFLEMMD